MLQLEPLKMTKNKHGENYRRKSWTTALIAAAASTLQTTLSDTPVATLVLSRGIVRCQSLLGGDGLLIIQIVN